MSSAPPPGDENNGRSRIVNPSQRSGSSRRESSESTTRTYLSGFPRAASSTGPPPRASESSSGPSGASGASSSIQRASESSSGSAGPSGSSRTSSGTSSAFPRAVISTGPPPSLHRAAVSSSGPSGASSSTPRASESSSGSSGPSGASSSGSSFSLSNPGRWNSVYSSSRTHTASAISNQPSVVPRIPDRLLPSSGGAGYRFYDGPSYLQFPAPEAPAAPEPVDIENIPPRRPSPTPGPAQLAISAYEAVRAVHQAPGAAGTPAPRPESPELFDDGESSRTLGRGTQERRRWAARVPADMHAPAPSPYYPIRYLYPLRPDVMPGRPRTPPDVIELPPPAPEVPAAAPEVQAPAPAPEVVEADNHPPLNQELQMAQFEAQFRRAREQFERIQANGVEELDFQAVINADAPAQNPRARRRPRFNEGGHRRRPSPEGPRQNIINPRAISPHGFPPRRASDRRFVNGLFTSVGPLSGQGVRHLIIPNVSNEAYNDVSVLRTWGEWREMESRRFTGATWFFNTRTEESTWTKPPMLATYDSEATRLYTESNFAALLSEEEGASVAAAARGPHRHAPARQIADPYFFDPSDRRRIRAAAAALRRENEELMRQMMGNNNNN